VAWSALTGVPEEAGNSASYVLEIYKLALMD